MAAGRNENMAAGVIHQIKREKDSVSKGVVSFPCGKSHSGSSDIVQIRQRGGTLLPCC